MGDSKEIKYLEIQEYVRTTTETLFKQLDTSSNDMFFYLCHMLENKYNKPCWISERFGEEEGVNHGHIDVIDGKSEIYGIICTLLAVTVLLSNKTVVLLLIIDGKEVFRLNFMEQLS